MNTSFDWSLVRSFLAALEHGSLLGAARALKASQPTLGRHIAELESQLGVLLFERTGRGLLPTEAALQLADSARLMEAGAHQLARAASCTDDMISGTVRITASQPVACYLLPPVLARLRQHHPGIQVELVVSNEVSNLLRREADIAVRMVRPEQGSLVAQLIGEVKLCACASQSYLQRRGIPQEPGDLLNHDLIGNDRQDLLLKAFAAGGYPVTPEHFAFRTDDLIATWEAVRAGLGIGFLGQYQLRLDEQVQRVLPQMAIQGLPMWLTVHQEIRTNRRIRTVYDFLAAEMPGQL